VRRGVQTVQTVCMSDGAAAKVLSYLCTRNK